MKFLTKKSYPLLVLAVGVLLFVLKVFFENFFCHYYILDNQHSLGLCSWYFHERTLPGSLAAAFIAFLVATMPFWLVMIPLRPTVFIIWKLYAAVAVPVVVIATVLIVNIEPSGFIDVRQPMYLAILYGGYFLISLFVLATAWWKSRKQ